MNFISLCRRREWGQQGIEPHGECAKLWEVAIAAARVYSGVDSTGWEKAMKLIIATSHSFARSHYSFDKNVNNVRPADNHVNNFQMHRKIAITD